MHLHPGMSVLLCRTCALRCQREITMKRSRLLCERLWRVNSTETNRNWTEYGGKTALEASKAGMNCLPETIIFPFFLPCTCRQNWQSRTKLVIMALCTSPFFSPLPFSSLHHLFSSPLTDPLITGPWNKAEILESKSLSLLFMPQMTIYQWAIISSALRPASCACLCFPWLSSCLPLFWFNISKCPTHRSPITRIRRAYVTQSDMKSHSGGAGKERELRMMSREWDCMRACLRVMVVVECQMMLWGFVLLTFTSVSKENHSYLKPHDTVTVQRLLPVRHRHYRRIGFSTKSVFLTWLCLIHTRVPYQRLPSHTFCFCLT